MGTSFQSCYQTGLSIDPTMILGRRSFLKFVSAALAGAQVGSASGQYQSPTFYADKSLGFAFKIPEGWHLEAFRKDFKKLLGGQKLAAPFVDDQEFFDDLTEGLMATLSKYPIVGDDSKRFSPSVTFFRADDSSLTGFESLRDLMLDSISAFSKVLTDYSCFEDPKYLPRNDCVMVRAKSIFLFEHVEMKSVLIDDETFLILHGGFIYTIHLYDSPYSGDVSQEEFQIFRDSLHIA